METKTAKNIVILTIILTSLVIACIRVRPDFPSRPASWYGTYEALTHVYVGVLMFGPVIYWRTRGATYGESRPDDSDIVAIISLIHAVILTFVVEAIMFFKQVPYPWVQQ